MSGDGEIWLDDQDLPLRLTLHVAYPEEANGDRVSADIQTDFSGYPAAAATQRAGAWLAGALHLPRTSGEWQQAAYHSGLALGVVGLVILLITAATSRKLYVAVAVAVIVSTVVTPLLQSHRVAAFSANVAAQRAAQEAEQAEAGRRARNSAANAYRRLDGQRRPAGRSGRRAVPRSTGRLARRAAGDIRHPPPHRAGACAG